ncbi:MAG TPA: rod shape-determining protein MreD [Actinomycetota bacterium]|nr:rod shape-determining protein MreD [Actinomycetota bacterium]
MARRVLVTIVVIVTGLLLQSTVFAQLRLLGVSPELMFLITIVVAILEGPQEGAITGFAAGLAQDFLLDQPKGVTALTLTLVGYSAGLARQYIVSASPLLPTILVAVGTAAGLIFYQTVAFLLDQLQETVVFAVRVTLLSALYGAILTPILYPLLRRVVEGSRPKRVVRF